MINTLRTEVTHLSEQTSSLSALVKQGKQQNIFAVQPFGWWRRDKALLRDAVIQAAANATIQSASYAWPAKYNAIAFLSDSDIDLPGLKLQQLAVNRAEFHNRDMIFGDFSQTSLVDVLFAPEDKHSDIWLTDSKFRNAQLSNVRFRSVFLDRSDFQYMDMIDGQFIRSTINGADFSHSHLRDVLFDAVRAQNVNFADCALKSVLFSV